MVNPRNDEILITFDLELRLWWLFLYFLVLLQQ